MPGNIQLKTIGFSTAVDELRPPVGENWRITGIVEIGNGGTLVITNGTIVEDFRTADLGNGGIVINNEWYLTTAALTAVRGWLISVVVRP